jgi:hypothetical protein
VGAHAIRARDTSNLKRAEQNGADERKHCEHGQHVELQGKVHVAFSASFWMSESTRAQTSF